MRFDPSETHTRQCKYDQRSCTVLRSGSFESGARRSEMKKYAYDGGRNDPGPRYVEPWFRTDDLHFLVVGISDAALTAACDGGQADLRYGPACTSGQ